MARSRDLVAQRERLSEATWSVLTERGLPGLTLRAVAERAGCTTGLVMHAFPTKESLLLHARDLLHARTKVQLESAESRTAAVHEVAAPRAETPPASPPQEVAAPRAETPPASPPQEVAAPRAEAVLRAVMLEAMSLDDASVDVARVWISYLAASLADPVLAARHIDGNRSLIARVTRLLRDCRPEWDDERTHAETLALISLADGANTLATVDPATYTPALQRRMMTDAITRALDSPAESRTSVGVPDDIPTDVRDSAIDAAPGAGMRIRAFEVQDTDAVTALWAECGLTRPWNDARTDIARKLAVQRDLFLVAELDDTTEHGARTEHGAAAEPGGTTEHGAAAGPGTGAGRIVGTVMAGYDGHRGWVNYLAVDPGMRGRGLGRALMDRVERMLVERGCPKLNLQIREDNEVVQDFYRTLGYTRDAAVSFGKRLIPDT